jgi:4-hydroxy-tetrahydrodipicolinate reductase
MRVGLLGFGRTGRAVASVILRNPEIRLEWVIRRTTKLEHRSVPEYLGIESDEPGLIFSKDEFCARDLLEDQPVDAIVDFSSESGLDYYGSAAMEKRTPIVSAISHYSADGMRKIRVIASHTPVLWSPNITVGINFMMLAARTLQSIAPYADVQIIEEHFREKTEVSGTAGRISRLLGVDENSIKQIRAGGIIGNHEVLFGFPYQTVRLRHESISREAFGNGAIFAARRLVGLGNGLYRMEDLLRPYFAGQGESSTL